MLTNSYIIHLEHATKREPQVEYLRNVLPGDVTVLDAVDVNSLTQADMGQYRKRLHRPHYPFDLRMSEIACFLSHRKVWREIVDSSADFAMVVEDDVQLDSDCFGAALDLALRSANPHSYIRFPKSNREANQSTLDRNGNARVFYPTIIGLGMQVQLVGREAALSLLSWTNLFDRPVDTALQLNWLSGVNLQTVQPSGVSEVSNALGGSTIGSKLPLYEKIWHELARPYYRNRHKCAASKHAKLVKLPMRSY